MSQAPLRKQSRWSLWIPLGKSPDSHGTRCRRPRVADITWFYRRFYRIWTMYMSLSLSHCTSILYIYIYYVYIYIYVCVCDLVFLIYLFMIFFWYLSTSPHRTGKKKRSMTEPLDLCRGPLKIWLCDFGCNQWHHGSGWWIGFGKIFTGNPWGFYHEMNWVFRLIFSHHPSLWCEDFPALNLDLYCIYSLVGGIPTYPSEKWWSE